ncbi:transporter, CPA2 family [Verrucomicrobium sp. GAS474]|uniref:cation:proton antiporter n=1 Tax=Verrucomicrobium sp. GAS474 TaxID=1882831 RepID=UPI0008797BEF|nr:cation:proton antiporter [Verrucomicrobium sp. GAS474]SDU05134.1 transporter, CPA2 family [Verrucomicrobium sp. GAS474]
MSFLAAAPESADAALSHFLLQLSLILVVARAAGKAARLVGQPQVVGEMVAGILLGPTCFGSLMPGTFHALFETASPLPLSILSQIGLILILFQIGLEFDFGHLREGGNRRAVRWVAAVGIVFPALLGAGFGWLSRGTFAPRVPGPTYVSFMAVALCITAMPVLGRILLELGIGRSRVGVLAITCAAVGDVAGWLMLAAVTALAQARLDGGFLALRFGAVALFVAGTWFAVRPLLRRLARRAVSTDGAAAVGLLLAALFVFGWATQEIGIHVIFGGFWCGVLLHEELAFVAWWRERASLLVGVFFLPIFFTYTGLHTDVNGLTAASLWGWCALLLVVAVVGKFGGCWAAGRVAGLPPAEARCLAILMNTRGLLELVVAAVGYQLGIIPQTLFTMLVLMALASTFLTTPCLRAWLPATRPGEPQPQ